MAKQKNSKGPRKLQSYHVKERNSVFVSFYDGVVSGTIEITPEQAIAIGQTGNMAKVYREEMEKSADG